MAADGVQRLLERAPRTLFVTLRPEETQQAVATDTARTGGSNDGQQKEALPLTAQWLSTVAFDRQSTKRSKLKNPHRF